MTQVAMSATIQASADKVWELVSDFNALPKYSEAIISSSLEGEGVGAVRTLTLGDDSQAKEKLESLDNQKKTLTYSIVEAGLPIKNYLSTVAVKETVSNQCEVSWSSTFEPDGGPEAEGKNAIEGLYAVCFEGLKKYFG